MEYLITASLTPITVLSTSLLAGYAQPVT